MTTRADKFKSSIRSAVRTPLNRLLNRLDPPVLVLLYHRVTSLPADPEMLAVSPENFHAQLRYLKEHFPIVRFDENWTTAPKPAVAITFDDGYADNALEALPILEDVGVAATFFISTGTIGTRSEFWWYELERILLGTPHPPSRLALEDERFGRSWLTATPAERQACYRELVQLMNNTDGHRRSNWLAQLRHWAGAHGEASDRHRSMTVDELRLLAGSGNVTIGAHTVTHTRLSCLSPEAQREEIITSKAHLEAWLGRDISTFSYPFGRRSDYTHQSMALCRQSGFIKAAANFPGQAHHWTDPYQIPRHLVRNWPVATFAAKLRTFWTR